MEAQEHLRELLVKILGPKLKGVTSYGVRWDRELNRATLGVFLDKPETMELVGNSLPSAIDDMPVRVARRGPARAA